MLLGTSLGRGVTSLSKVSDQRENEYNFSGLFFSVAIVLCGPSESWCYFLHHSFGFLILRNCCLLLRKAQSCSLCPGTDSPDGKTHKGFGQLPCLRQGAVWCVMLAMLFFIKCDLFIFLLCNCVPEDWHNHHCGWCNHNCGWCKTLAKDNLPLLYIFPCYVIIALAPMPVPLNNNTITTVGVRYYWELCFNWAWPFLFFSVGMTFTSTTGVVVVLISKTDPLCWVILCCRTVADNISCTLSPDFYILRNDFFLLRNAQCGFILRVSPSRWRHWRSLEPFWERV